MSRSQPTSRGRESQPTATASKPPSPAIRRSRGIRPPRPRLPKRPEGTASRALDRRPGSGSGARVRSPAVPVRRGRGVQPALDDTLHARQPFGQPRERTRESGIGSAHSEQDGEDHRHRIAAHRAVPPIRSGQLGSTDTDTLPVIRAIGACLRLRCGDCACFCYTPPGPRFCSRIIFASHSVRTLFLSENCAPVEPWRMAAGGKYGPVRLQEHMPLLRIDPLFLANRTAASVGRPILTAAASLSRFSSPSSLHAFVVSPSLRRPSCRPAGLTQLRIVPVSGPNPRPSNYGLRPALTNSIISAARTRKPPEAPVPASWGERVDWPSSSRTGRSPPRAFRPGERGSPCSA